MSNLNDTQWSDFLKLLDTALELPETDRAGWLAKLASTDAAVAAQISASLAARAKNGFSRFLEGASPLAAEALAGATLVGQQIGPYVIDAELGRGGMGSVWRAHRTDGRYEGIVAIKFVHATWIGGAAEQRFEQEGRVLARLNHPNIARLLDAGVLEAKQPYLVLEYVEGQPLDAYCERQGLALRPRIELFLGVLEAVAHAHANLVVHRDIKPGNVLVARDGTVKLLDFGIAKLADDAQGTQQTQLSAVILTPQYAAPEQLLGQPITTATDVYALGLTLYLLLTGRHAAGEIARSSADLIHSVLTTEAPRASKVAHLAAIDGRALAGDLDNILNKAMKKAPEERYVSAAAFADDLRRFLANEPVLARPDTVGYRTSKFVMRHRLGTALASIAVMALTASAIVSAIQTQRASAAAARANVERARADDAARRAERERDLALAAAAQNLDLTALTSSLLAEALPEDRPEVTTAILLRGVRMVRDSKATSPIRRAQMLELLATHFENNRDYDRASQLYIEAHALALEGNDPGVRATTSCHLAQMNAAQGNDETPLASIDLALRDLTDTPEYADSRIICRLARSEIFIMHGKPAIDELEAAARLFPTLQVPDHEVEGAALSLLAAAYTDAMRVPEAMQAYQREEKLLDDTGGSHQRDAVVHFSNASVFFWKIGRPLDARVNLERAQQIDRERGNVDVDDAVSLVIKARIAGQLGRAPQSVATYERAMKRAHATGDVQTESVASGEEIPAFVEARDFQHAGDLLPAVERKLHSLFSPDHWMFAMLRMQAALIAEHGGDAARARHLADEAISLFEAGSTTPAYQFPIALVQRAGIEQRAGRGDAARSDAERALSIYEAHFGRAIRSASIGDALMALGAVALSRENAAASFELAAVHYESSIGAEHTKTKSARTQAAAARGVTQ